MAEYPKTMQLAYLPNETVSVERFGAKGDGVTDDTAAIQAAIDSFGANGGRLYFPNGTYKTTSTINFTYGNILIEGSNFTQNWTLPTYATTGATIQAAHTGDIFQLTNTAVGSTTTSNIGFSSINVFGNSVGSKSQSAFFFDLGGDAKFSRGFFFHKVGVRFCTSAWLFSKGTATGGNTTQGQIGDVQIVECNAQFNTRVVDSFSSVSNYVQINGFKFNRNDAGNNDNLVIDVSVYGGQISGNILEGQDDTIRVSSSNAFSIKQNYFESNGGDYVISLNASCQNGEVGENFYSVGVTAKYKVYVGNAFNCRISDPYMALTLMECDQVNNRKYDNTGAAERSYGFMSNIARPDLNAQNGNIARSSAANFITVSSSFVQTDTKLGYERTAYDPYTTSGPGGYSRPTKTISGNVGQYVVLTLMMRRDDVSALNPYVQFYINASASSAVGSWETPIYNYVTQQLGDDDSEEILITMYGKILSAMTTFDYTIFPYGVSPPAGLVARFSNAEIHVVDNVNDIRHSLNLEWINTFPGSAPTIGNWSTYDRVYDRVPAAGGKIGYICTAGGNPGTWKGYGNIDP